MHDLNKLEARTGKFGWMAFSGVDKFPLVAKILVDMRLQELFEENRRLKEENQRLELALFWKTYGVVQLRNQISYAIDSSRVAQCKCRSCHWAGKCRESDGGWECKHKPCFETFARKCGFTVVGEDDDFSPIFDEILDGDECDNGDLQFFYSGDAHFVMASSITDWVVLGYGMKLNQAKSVHDPELVKLRKFFEMMDSMRS